MAHPGDVSDLVDTETYRARVLDWANGTSEEAWDLFQRLVAACDSLTLERAFGKNLSAAGYATTEREERLKELPCSACGRLGDCCRCEDEAVAC